MDIDLQDLMEIALGTRHEDPIDFEVDVLQPAPQSHFGTSSSTGMVTLHSGDNGGRFALGSTVAIVLLLSERHSKEKTVRQL